MLTGREAQGGEGRSGPPQGSAPGAAPAEGQAGRLSTRRIYGGRVVQLDVDRVRFPDGSTGELEVIRHSGAAAVVALADPPDAADPRVVLLSQYRYAAGGEILEIPAGRLEPGERPDACARRELLEETGYEARSWRRLTALYTTPGFTDERIHLFLAHDLVAHEPAGEADEFIEVRVVPWSQAMEQIRDGQLVDAKSICALLYVARFLRV